MGRNGKRRSGSFGVEGDGPKSHKQKHKQKVANASSKSKSKAKAAPKSKGRKSQELKQYGNRQLSATNHTNLKAASSPPNAKPGKFGGRSKAEGRGKGKPLSNEKKAPSGRSSKAKSSGGGINNGGVGSVFGKIVKRKGPNPDSGDNFFGFPSLNRLPSQSSIGGRYKARNNRHEKPFAAKKKSSVKFGHRRNSPLSKAAAAALPKKNNSTRKFKLVMPMVTRSSASVAWMSKSSKSAKRSSRSRRSSLSLSLSLSLDDSAVQDVKNSPESKSYSLFPSDLGQDHHDLPICPKAMDALHLELLHFAEYVKLSDDETKAREVVIGHTERFCQAMWSSSGPRLSEPVECRIFGSFATQDVCTFESDVDMAIFGVVPPDHRNPDPNDNSLARAIAQQEKNQAKASAVMDDTNTQSCGGDAERQPEASADCGDQGSAKRRKQEKVQKWKAALADPVVEPPSESSDKRSSVSDVIDLSVDDDHDGDEQGKEKKDDCDEQDDTETGIGFFVIDRTADESKDLDVVTNSSDDDGKPENLPDGADDQGDASGDGSEGKQQQQDDQQDDQQHEQQEVISISSQDTADQLEGLNEKDRMASLEQFESVDNDDDNDDVDLQQIAARLPDADESMRSEAGHGGTSRNVNADSSPMASAASARTPPSGTKRKLSISLCSSTTADSDASAVDDDDIDESDIQVSFVTNPSALGRSNGGNDNNSKAATPAAAAVVGPTGETRVKVVRALNGLGRKLRKLPMAENLHVRKHARVPIVNMTCSLGFECDIAIGGHQGIDTSAYASTHTKRFKSFAPVVLLLKMLLAQHDLDKPFTGGMGSFRLYVLVAYHLERHLAHGGKDRPGDVLLSFLFRYSNSVHHANMPRAASSRLDRMKIFKTKDGISGDMSGCFKIENCVLVFRACFDALCRVLKPSRGNSGNGKSILQYIIDNAKLEDRRRLCGSKAARLTRSMISCDHVFRNIIPQSLCGPPEASGNRMIPLFSFGQNHRQLIDPHASPRFRRR